MGSHSAGRHSRGGSTATDRRHRTPAPVPATPAPAQGPPVDDQAPRPVQPLTARARTPYPPGGAPRSGWVTSEWSSNPSAATASLPRRLPPPRPATPPPGEMDTVTGPISMSTSRRRELFGDDPQDSQADSYGRSARRGQPAGSGRSPVRGRPAGRHDDTADLGVRRPGELDPQSVGDDSGAAGGPGTSRISLFEPGRPSGSLRVETSPRSGTRADGARSTTASRAAASRSTASGGRASGGTAARAAGSATGRGAHRAPAPRRGPSRTRMVVAGTASLAGLSAIVTGVALSGDQPVTAAGPTTGATPLVQVAGSRPAAFGSGDTQASRDGRVPLPTYPAAAPTTAGGSGTTGQSDSGYRTSPNGPSAPSYSGSGTQQQGLSGYEIPFVPLTPRSTATPSPAAGGTTAPGTTTPGTTTPGTTTPGTTTPGSTAPGTTAPGSTAPGTTTPTQPGATTPPTQHGTSPAQTRPTTSSSSTPAPAPTSREGSLPFNPTPVEVTPIWDLLFPSQSQSTSTSSSAPSGTSATPAPAASSSTHAGS
ncbi:hypothetical protein Franean1_6079 [Parafrankia sp. EAN1pec]|uniref:hypothetical protein n=1 Tax=Parafrankia sp. (strain EAN1pec) TaxID=298653 RepID=UPI000054035A|nr:hypothetical protein Franean1_6079 [Frankia sp. EAN1pec]